MSGGREARRHDTAFVGVEAEAFPLAAVGAGLDFVEMLGVFEAEFEAVGAVGG